MSHEEKEILKHILSEQEKILRDQERILQCQGEILRDQGENHRLVKKIEVDLQRLSHVERKTEEIVERILHIIRHPKHFTLNLKLLEKNMSIGNIVAGTTGQIEAEVFENGVLYTPPVGTTYEPTITWTSSDPSVTFTPATNDDSGGEVPLSQQIVVNVPAGDTSTSVTITGTTLDPNGNTISGTISIPVTAAPQVFTLQLTQVA